MLRVDRWEMRCRFNQANLATRARNGEFDLVITRPSALATESYGQEPGTNSHEVYYRDKGTGVEVARVHQFVKPSGELGASGEPDPQRLTIDGVRYRLNKGPEINRDPSLQFVGEWQATYKLCRRLCCRVFDEPAGCFISSLGTRMMRLVKSARRSSDDPLSGGSSPLSAS